MKTKKTYAKHKDIPFPTFEEFKNGIRRAQERVVARKIYTKAQEVEDAQIEALAEEV